MAGSIRVLHVDDRPTFAETAVAFLEEKNERLLVETATSAAAALDRLPGGIDCIVSDYEMPGKDGIEFLEAVRERHPDLPFILYTGKGSEEIASEAISAGVTDYLQKETGTGQYAVLANRIENAVEQYRSQVALEENRERLSYFIEQSPLGVIEWNTDYECVRLNEAASEILGYTAPELRSESWRALVPSEDLDETERAIAGLLSEGEGYDGIFENVRKDGERIRCEWHNRVVTDDEGEPIAVFSLFQEVTQRARREERLKQYEQILETIDDAAFVVGEERRIEYANEGSLGNVDVSREEVVGEPIIPIVDTFAEDEAAADRFAEALDQAFDAKTDTDSPQRMELVLIVNGERLVFEYQFSPIVDEGEPTAVAVTSRNVTERRLREQRLQRHREYTDRIFDAIDDVFFIYDEEGLLARWNETFTEVTGYADDELTAMHGADFVPESYRTVAESAIETAFETGSARLEAPVLRSDGTTVQYGFVASRVVHPDGSPRLVGIGRDITERKRRERALERQNERLEEFASVVSHDLRNPLRVAESYLELAREERDSEYLASVGDAHERMRTLIEDLLTLAREGEPVTEFEPVDLPSVVEDCWATVETGNATLAVAADRSIEADRSRLRQLLANLFRNAVEHGGEKVTITVTDLPDGEGFAVADDGPGIAESEREAVFEAGYSTSDDGTGFGLSIVDEIAEAHDWTVTVEENDSGGARFEITGVTVD